MMLKLLYGYFLNNIQNQLKSEQENLEDEIAKKAKRRKKLMQGDVESDYDSFFRNS